MADVGLTAIAGFLSVGVMYYAVYKFGLQEAGEELILNMFYVASLTMIGLYFFNHMSPNQFNYSCSICAATIGHICVTRDLPLSLGHAAPHADILLCPQAMEDLHQARPVDDLLGGRGYCRSLQLRHLY